MTRTIDYTQTEPPADLDADAAAPDPGNRSENSASNSQCPSWCALRHPEAEPVRFHESAPLLSALSCHNDIPGDSSEISAFSAVEQGEDQPTIHLYWGEDQNLMLELEEARALCRNIESLVRTVSAIRAAGGSASD